MCWSHTLTLTTLGRAASGEEGFSGRDNNDKAHRGAFEHNAPDSAHIHEMEAQWENQKGKRAGREPKEPLYTAQDVLNCMKLVRTYDYNREFEIFGGLKGRFQDAGHLLGSAFIELWITEEMSPRKSYFRET